MSFKEFQQFISLAHDKGLASGSSQKAVKSVNLLRLVTGHDREPSPRQTRVALVVDAESCLDRLYGGYFSGEHTFNTFNVKDNFFVIFLRLELWWTMGKYGGVSRHIEQHCAKK